MTRALLSPAGDCGVYTLVCRCAVVLLPLLLLLFLLLLPPPHAVCAKFISR